MAAVVRDANGRVKSGALNPGGLTKEAREMRDKMREMLRADAEDVHAALVDLVRERNAPAVIYAHTLLHGKDPDKLDVEHSGALENPAKPLTTAQLVAIAAASKPEPP